MVCDHVHQISVFRILLLLVVEKPEDVRGMFLGEFPDLAVRALEGILPGCGRDFAEEVLHRPVVTHVEAVFL